MGDVEMIGDPLTKFYTRLNGLIAEQEDDLSMFEVLDILSVVEFRLKLELTVEVVEDD